jgi:hypothetical protein
MNMINKYNFILFSISILMVSGCEDVELAFPGNTQESSPSEPKGSIGWTILYDENNVGQLPENLQGTNTTLGSIDVVDTNPDDAIKLVTIQSQKINGNNRNLFTVMKDSLDTWKVVLLSTANIDYETIHSQNGSSTQSEIVMEITDDSPTEEKGILTVSVLITNVNESPTWLNTSIGTTADEGILYESSGITWGDVDLDDSHELSSDNLPGWLTLDVNKLTGTPSTADVNPNTSFTLKLQDLGGLEITKSFTIDVRGNEAPSFNGSLNDIWEEEISDSWNITFTDPNNADYSTLTATASSLMGLTFQQNGMSGTVSGMFSHFYVDQYVTFQITLNDGRPGHPLETTQTFTIYVAPNDPPFFNGSLNDTWEEEIDDSWYITFTDPNNADYGNLTAEISEYGSSLGLTFLQQNSTSGRVSGMLPHSYAGQNVDFDITVNDNRNGIPLTTTTTFTISVDENDPPSFNGPFNDTWEEEINDTWSITFTDPDPNNADYGTLEATLNSELGLTFQQNGMSGIVSGVLPHSYAGEDVDFEITLNDGRPGNPLETTQTFTISVDPNDPPEFTNTDNIIQLIHHGCQYNYDVNWYDPEGDGVEFVGNESIGWLNVDNSSGVLSGTPAYSDIGTGSVLLTITDDRPNASIATEHIFTITVDQNYAPQFDNAASVDSTATVGSYYSFQFGISDANSDDFNFTVPTRPSWLSYNSSNYEIYGWPSSADTTHIVTVQAEDCGQATPFTFSIEVSE